MQKNKLTMTSNQSAIHGRFEVSANGQILLSRTWGPFNVECVHAYRDYLNLQVKSLAGQKWAMLAVTIGMPLHTPDSLAEMVNTIRQQKKLGRCATAIVLVDVEVENVVKSMLTSLYNQANEPFIFADDEASATIWLEAQIAGAKNA